MLKIQFFYVGRRGKKKSRKYSDIFNIQEKEWNLNVTEKQKKGV